MTLFKNTYRVESARLKGWDYSSVGAYFVTICVNGMQCWFGDVINGEMKLSTVGNIAAEEWMKTEQVRANVTLDEWVIMPNHMHSIVVIDEKTSVETTRRVVSTTPSKTLKPNSLGSITGQFKSASTKRIHSMGYPDFAWQPRYHDHIIRDRKSFAKIQGTFRIMSCNGNSIVTTHPGWSSGGHRIATIT